MHFNEVSDFLKKKNIPVKLCKCHERFSLILFSFVYDYYFNVDNKKHRFRICWSTFLTKTDKKKIQNIQKLTVMTMWSKF